MAGRKSTPVGHDRQGIWREACQQLAARLGFTELEVWSVWQWTALCLEYELHIPRNAAEETAYERTLELLDKKGSVPN